MDLYNSIFYDIPVEGDINSHQFLVERSKEYIGISEETDQEIQVLLDEITSLRQNLLDTEQELLEALENTNAPASETISPNIAQTGISSNVGGSSGAVGLSGTY